MATVDAQKTIDSVYEFAERFGRLHTALLLHVSLPLGLTPEIVHLIRVNFLSRGQWQVPWIAEADILLAPFCRHISGEMYQINPKVRELILNELRRTSQFPQNRVLQIARFLAAYTSRLLPDVDNPMLKNFIEAQHWTALAYIDPAKASEALVRAMAQESQQLQEGQVSGLLRVAGIANSLSLPLYNEPRVLLYSMMLKKMVKKPNDETLPQLIDMFDADSATTEISGIPIPSSQTLLQVLRAASSLSSSRFSPSRQLEEQGTEKLSAEVLQTNETLKSKELSDYPGLGWGDIKTLAQHPYLLMDNGAWIPSKVLFNHTSKVFEYSDEDQVGYTQYFADNYQKKRFDVDRTKLMLDRVPLTFIDRYTLELRTREVKYSQIQYTVNVLSKEENRLNDYIDNILSNKEISIDFAHVISLCILVLSNEDEILLARRYSRLRYYPGQWQASISEQFEIKDLFETRYDPVTDEEVIDRNKPKPEHSVIPGFIKRALEEELNIHTERDGKIDDYKVDDARILSLFLEAGILSIGICACIKLDIPSSKVLEIARDHAYSNFHQELDKFEMLPISKIEEELLNPSYKYESISPYMLYMYLLYIGDEDTKLRIDKRLNVK